MRHRLLAVVLSALALSACLDRNPVRSPPDHAELARGGVWVAYNFGCKRGCDQIRRGDRILAVDGRPVSSGAEIDAMDLARGDPVRLRVARHGSADEVEVTIVAGPNHRLPPIAALPPLLTVGTAALDRAPTWARSDLFGRAIAPLRLASDAGEVTGRQFYGRAALFLVWRMPPRREIEQHQASLRALPRVYAHLQSFADRLRIAGVYPCFVFGSSVEPGFHRDLRQVARRDAIPGETGDVPIFGLLSLPWDDPTAGIEPADMVARFHSMSELIIIDDRGIVRFHTRGLPVDPADTLAAAIDFALHELRDGPPLGHGAVRVY